MVERIALPRQRKITIVPGVPNTTPSVTLPALSPVFTRVPQPATGYPCHGEAPGSEEQTEAEAAAKTETDVQPEEAVRESAALPEEMQEYVVRCVGDCFARLRQQQQETTDFINEQWRCFLSGLSLPELPVRGAAPSETEGTGVTRQDIEDRVSAIARELMEIIGK